MLESMKETTRFTIQVNGWNYPARYWVHNRILHVASATGAKTAPVKGVERPGPLAEKLLRQIISETYAA